MMEPGKEWNGLFHRLFALLDGIMEWNGSLSKNCDSFHFVNFHSLALFFPHSIMEWNAKLQYNRS